jgi:hypothetical protein
LQRVLTTVTLLGLLVATAAAFAITEHLKLIKSPLYGTIVSKVLSPVCHCSDSTATIQIKLRHRDRVTVTIVDSHKHTVATLASGRPVAPHQAVSLPWHGRTDTGALAPDGDYYPWVHLANARRTFHLPNQIVLDTKAPKVLSASGGKGVLFVGPGRGLAIHYAFSEPAHPVVYLGGRLIITGHRTRQDAAVKWAGRLDGRALRAGKYVLSVGALDLAGNETPPAARKDVTVVIRYLELMPGLVDVRAGTRFEVRVETRSARYTWRLDHRSGVGHGKVLKLRAPSAPGRYRLLVAEHGHAATVVVRVRTR